MAATGIGVGLDATVDIGPDWLTPGRVLALSNPILQPVTLPAGVIVRICTNNPMRVGLFILGPVTITGVLTVGPYKDPSSFGINLTSTNNALAVSLSQWMSFTCQEWYAYSQGGATLVVGEMVRPYPEFARVRARYQDRTNDSV